MKKLLLPLVLLFVGTGGGIGAAKFLGAGAHEEEVAENPCGEVPDAHVAEAETFAEPEIPPEERAYARLNNQFVVPVVRDEKVQSLVVLSLSLEVPPGGEQAVFTHEPRLRDLFLQVLFEHANTGGFDGAFTTTGKMQVLRDALRRAAVEGVGLGIRDVLILDIVRQDTN